MEKAIQQWANLGAFVLPYSMKIMVDVQKFKR